MRIGLLAAGLILAAGAALAQAPEPIGGYTQRFMSPCGEPWRAGDGEPYPLFKWFAATDVNHDGAIDLAEFRHDHEGFFEALDQDHNGMLESAEIAFYEKRVAADVLMGQLFGAASPAPVGPPGAWGAQVIKAQYPGGGLGGALNQVGPPGAQGPGADLGATRPQRQPLVGAAAYALLNDAEPVTSADSNLDGRVTKAEFQAAADRRFKRLDRNGDGKLTIEELPKPQAQVLAEAEAKKKSKKR